jgi:hypothetical protein
MTGPVLMERAMGIEPTSEAWEASILPLYDARSGLLLAIIHNCNNPRKDPRTISIGTLVSRGQWPGVDNLLERRGGTDHSNAPSRIDA